MKLLLDENLSRTSVPFLQTAYPGSSQVALEGLEQAGDAEIWQYAKDNAFVIVTKDRHYVATAHSYPINELRADILQLVVPRVGQPPGSGGFPVMTWLLDLARTAGQRISH